MEKIYNPKWENATYAGKKVREDMELLFDQTRLSISTIQSMMSEFEEDALRVLKDTGSLQSAIAEINDLQEKKKRFMEQARTEAERELEKKEAGDIDAKSVNERTEEVIAQVKEGVECHIEEGDVLESPGPFASEKILTVTIKVGENSLAMLMDFLDMTNLEYEVME